MATQANPSLDPRAGKPPRLGLRATLVLTLFTCGSAPPEAAMADDSVKPGTAEPRDELRLQVKVVDTAGTPISNATVEVFALTSPGFVPANIATETRMVEFDEDPRLKTDCRREARHSPSGSRPRVHPARRKAAHAAGGQSLEPAARLGDGAVARRCPPTTAPVTGTVVGRDGRPIADATVMQSGDGPYRGDATTDAQGRFTIDGVPEGWRSCLWKQPTAGSPASRSLPGKATVDNRP